ncbi:coiled-coil domain-containing protein 74B-like [Babylonia areolata]|uniref:coiled-coil domain-containing protein 74B-like n=1 Tax=Babylonia areolata TaxID=304850 RepID=UPI003FD31A32
MLKQGLVQERIGDLTMNQLPPLNTLPQWSRVNNLDKARYPKPFVKDKHQPAGARQNMEEEENDLDLSGMNPAQRIQYLERSLMFLRQQHSDVLRALHGEVEGLKKENKDLQFKIVMSQKGQHSMSPEQPGTKAVEELSVRDISASSRRSKHLAGSSSREERLDELKVIFLEEEIKELKHALRETRNKNTYVQQLLEQSEETRKRQQASLDSLKYQATQGGAQMSQVAEQIADGQSPLEASGRPLSLAECQAVIRHLQQVNERQAHELERLKSDLRDVLYSHKWTPDAYLLAKAYIAEDDKKGDSPEAVSKSALPKIPLKNQTRKLPEVAYIRDTVSLPALKQTVGNKAVERRKRTQILQKAKLRREIVPHE